MSNRFDGVEKETIYNLIGQTVGAASSPVLWKSQGNEVDGDGLYATQDKYGRPCVFDDALAKEVWADAVDKLKEMLIVRLVSSGLMEHWTEDEINMTVGAWLEEEE